MSEWSNDDEWIDSTEQWQSPRHGSPYDHALLWKHGDETTLSPPVEISQRFSPERRARLRFNDLVTQWRKEIGHKSSLRKIVFNRAYLAIMLMAVDDDKNRRLMTRLILEELRDRGGHWYWALHAITGASPAKFGDGVEAVRHAWIEWGKSHGYFKDQHLA